MKKRWWITAALLATMVVGCSSEEESSQESAEEAAVASEEAAAETETTEGAEELPAEVEEEGYLIDDTGPVTKQNQVLLENEKGKLTLMGETMDFEGRLVAAVKVEGDLVLAKDFPYLKMNYIMSDGSVQEIAADFHEGTRFVEDGEIRLYRTFRGVEVTGEPVRLDYSLESNGFPEDEVFQTISLNPVGGEQMEVPAIYSVEEAGYEAAYGDVSIMKESKDLKMQVTGINVDQVYHDAVVITGTIESKKDMDISKKVFVERPFVENRKEIEMDISNTTLYAGVPVDFTITYQSPAFLFANDQSSILYFATNGLFMALDLTQKKEYEGEIELFDLRHSKPINGMHPEKPSYLGLVDASGVPHYKAELFNEEYSTSLHYDLGGEFTELTFKYGGSQHASNKKDPVTLSVYDGEVYAYQFEYEGEVTVEPLMSDTFTSETNLKEVTLDVTGLEEIIIDLEVPDVDSPPWSLITDAVLK